MTRAARLAALTCLVGAAAAHGGAMASPVGPAVESDAVPDVGGVYTATTGGRWAFEVDAGGSLVVYAVGGGYCAEAGTLVASGAWNGRSFDVQTPLYDLDPATGRCAGVSLEYSADRIVVIDDRSVEWCSEGGACLRLVRPVRYRAQLSAWIPHDTIADPYLPRPVDGLDAGLVDLAPDALAPCLAADQVESLVAGQGHVDLVEPLLAVVTVDFTITTLNQVADVTWEAASMSLGRSVAGNFSSGPAVDCVQAVTQPGSTVGRVTAFGRVIVMQLHAPLGIAPARRTDIAAAESAMLERFGCDGRDVSCDPREQALGVGQIDAWAVFGVGDSGALGVTTSTDGFPSFGLSLEARDSDVMATILHDSSCYTVTGLPGVLNMVELLHRLEPRASGPVSDWPDDTCEPRRLQGDEVPAAEFDGSRSELATFLLGTRYADGRR